MSHISPLINFAIGNQALEFPVIFDNGNIIHLGQIMCLVSCFRPFANTIVLYCIFILRIISP